MTASSNIQPPERRVNEEPNLVMTFSEDDDEAGNPGEFPMPLYNSNEDPDSVPTALTVRVNCRDEEVASEQARTSTSSGQLQEAAPPNDQQQEESLDEECPGPLKYRMVQRLLLLLLALGAAGVMAAFAAVTITNRKQASKNAPPSNSGNSLPTTSTDSDGDPEVRWEKITDLLMRRGLASPSTFLDASNPRARALDWLVVQDQTWTGLATEADEMHMLQRYVLMVFAYSTGVELWRTLGHWTKAVQLHECSFAGIDCDEEGRVVAMQLALFRLTGTIPEELGMVLTSLRTLILDENKLEGPIPDSLYDLTNLETMGLHENRLGSTLSPKIEQLSNLEYLYLGKNLFTGALPISALQTLTGLKEVHLGGTQFAGPVFDALLSWPNIREVAFDDMTNIRGTIPTEIGLLTDLEFLEITGIYPKLPTEIGLLTNLDTFYFYKPRIAHDEEYPLPATIPTEIGQLTNLVIFDIEGANYLTGTIPTEVGNLVNMQLFSIVNSDVGGVLPSEIGMMKKLEELHLSNLENMGGTVPSEFGNFTKHLFFFTIAATALTGTLPEEFCYLDIEIRMECPEVSCSCCLKLRCY